MELRDFFWGYQSKETANQGPKSLTSTTLFYDNDASLIEGMKHYINL